MERDEPFPRGPFRFCLISRKLALKPTGCFYGGQASSERTCWDSFSSLESLQRKRNVYFPKVMLCVHLVVGSKGCCVLWVAEHEGNCYCWPLRTPTWQFVGCSHLKAAVNRKKISWGAVPPRTCQTPCCEKCPYKKIAVVGRDQLVQPAYSPDLALSDYHLFRSMQVSLADIRFWNAEEVRKWVDNRIASKDEDFLDPKSTRYQKDGKKL